MVHYPVVIETSRLYKDQIQTPILEYRHPETTSHIGMVGLLHFGIPSYFAQAGEYIASRQTEEKAHVFAEGSWRAPQSDIEAASPDVQQRLTRFFGAGSLIQASLNRILHRGLGMVFQKSPEGLQSQDWQHHDYSDLEVAQRLTAKDIRGERLLARSFDIGTRLIPPFLAKPVARALVKSLLLGEDNIVQTSDKVLLHERDDLVMAAIDRQREQAPDSNFVIVWGAGHTLTMGAKLTERGYERTDEQAGTRWLTAVDLSRSAKNQP